MMRDQIQAIYDIALYIDDKCPSLGMFNYIWGMDPFISLKGVEEEMAREVLEPHVLGIAKPVNLGAAVRTVESGNANTHPTTYVSISSDLLVWESIFPHKASVPPNAPIEWFIRQLQDQLFPRVTGATDDLT